MDAQRKALSRLSEDARDGFGRVAAKGSFNKMQGKATKIGNLNLINTRGSAEDMEAEMLSMVGKQE